MDTYKIVRYKQKGRSKVMQKGLTLAQAQAHCKKPWTCGKGWFDGYTKE